MVFALRPLNFQYIGATDNHQEVHPIVADSVESACSEFQDLMTKPSAAQDLQQFQRLVFQVAESAIQLQLSLYRSAEEVVRDEQEVDRAIVNQMVLIKRVVEAIGSCILFFLVEVESDLPLLIH